MIIKGYKAFNKDMTNRYGIPFSVGQTYHATGSIKFGNDGNGFHLCKNLCDTFRYFPENNVTIAEVTGSGGFVKYDDEYNGYYDMYAVETITIDRILSREDIMDIMLNDHELNNRKFLMTYQLNAQEKLDYLKKYRHNNYMLSWLLYYQFGIKKVFEMSQEDIKEELRKVLTYGQNNN